LLAKGLLDTININLPVSSTTVIATQQKDVKDHVKTWAIIPQSLSNVVQVSLSAPAPSITVLDAKFLWQRPKSTYSASVGLKQAAVLHEMWTTPIQEGEDPNSHMARIKSGHAQINVRWKEFARQYVGLCNNIGIA
jgi:hypothetical protein